MYPNSMYFGLDVPIKGVPLRPKHMLFWVLVDGFNVSDHHTETILFTIDPSYGNVNQILLTLTRTQYLGP